MTELKITMLGPTSVGKTSLLTAMYEQFKNVVGSTSLQVTAEGDNANLLHERLIELKSLPDTFKSVKAEGGIAGSNEISNFTFSLRKRGTMTSSLKLHFLDYPGGYHKNKESYITQQLTQCVAVLIAIDAAALMEEDGQWHEYVNRPQQVTELFEKTYTDLDSPRLVILAPVKCEKYMKDSESTRRLHKTIREKYKNLLNHFRSQALLPKVAVVITPVQTVGSVFFSCIEVVGKEPQFVFRKPNSSDTYNPQGSEQPLRYLLSFLLKRHIEQRRWKFFDFIRVVFSKDTEFREAVRKFAEVYDKEAGSEVVQGQFLLNID